MASIEAGRSLSLEEAEKIAYEEEKVRNDPFEIEDTKRRNMQIIKQVIEREIQLEIRQQACERLGLVEEIESIRYQLEVLKGKKETARRGL